MSIVTNPNPVATQGDFNELPDPSDPLPKVGDFFTDRAGALYQKVLADDGTRFWLFIGGDILSGDVIRYISPTGDDSKSGTSPATARASLLRTLNDTHWSSAPNAKNYIVAAPGTYPVEPFMTAVIPAYLASPIVVVGGFADVAPAISGAATAVAGDKTSFTDAPNLAVPGLDNGLQSATIAWTRQSDGKTLLRKLSKSTNTDGYFQRQIGGAQVGDQWSIQEPTVTIQYSLGTIQTKGNPSPIRDQFQLIFYGVKLLAVNDAALDIGLGPTAFFFFRGVRTGEYGWDWDLAGSEATGGGGIVEGGASLLADIAVNQYLADFIDTSLYPPSSSIVSAGNEFVRAVVFDQEGDWYGYWCARDCGSFALDDNSALALTAPSLHDTSGVQCYEGVTGSFGQGGLVPTRVTMSGAGASARNALFVAAGAEIGMSGEYEFDLDVTDEAALHVDIDGRIDASGADAMDGDGGQVGVYVAPSGVLTVSKADVGSYTLTGAGSDLSFGETPKTPKAWGDLPYVNADGALGTIATPATTP